MALTLHGNNGLGTTNGTAAAPSLAAPDSDTGFYFGTNLIHASTDGTERLRIAADGKIGIGDASPTKALTVGTTTPVVLLDDQSSRTLEIRGPSTTHNATVLTTSNHDLLLGTNGTERLRITTDGPHLLLGGTSDVNEITESSANAGLVIGGTGFGNGGLAIINSTTGTGRIYFGDGVTNSPDRQRGQINYYHNGDYMNFATAGSERLRIDSSGNLVTGNQTSPTSSDTGNIYLKNGSTVGSVGVALNYATNAVFDSVWKYISNGGASKIIQNASLVSFNFVGSGSAGGGITWSEKVRIDSDGDVGINETSPDNKLHVTTTDSNAYSTNTSNTQNLTNALLKLQNLDGTDNSGVNNYVGIQFAVANGATSSAQLNYVRTGNNAGAFQFKARNASSTYPNLMTIKSDGFTGVGTTNPRRHFHIHNSATATVGMMLTNAATGESNDSQGFQFKVASDKHAEISQMENSDMRFFTDGGERLRIDSDGYLGLCGYGAPDTAVSIKLTGQAGDGTDDASDWGAAGIVNMYNTGGGSAGSEILLLGSQTSGVGQLSSGFGFGRESSSNWGTFLSFKTHETGTSNIDSIVERVRINSSGQVHTKLANTTDYGPSNWARTGTGNQGGASQSHPDPAIVWQNLGKSSSEQRYGSYIQSSSGGEKELYITIRNSSFYRITVKTSHNSTDADVAMWLVYGLNSSASGGTNNRIVNVVNTSSGGFTCTQQNTHVNSHDSTIKIAFSGSSNQGLRALVEIIGGF